jgi:hypothetical protein
VLFFGKKLFLFQPFQDQSTGVDRRPAIICALRIHPVLLKLDDTHKAVPQDNGDQFRVGIMKHTLSIPFARLFHLVEMERIRPSGCPGGSSAEAV